MTATRIPRGLVLLIAAGISGFGLAQNCVLPPGTVGVGNYCPKPKLKIPAVAAPAPAASAPVPVAAASATLATAQSALIAASAPSPSQAASSPMPVASTVVSSAALPSPKSVPPPIPGSVKKTWVILPTDGKLATTFERWAKADGMKLVWDAKQHVMLSSADTFSGTLIEALNRVLGSPAIRLSAYPLEACIYPNDPPVLRITRLGDQTLECAP